MSYSPTPYASRMGSPRLEDQRPQRAPIQVVTEQSPLLREPNTKPDDGDDDDGDLFHADFSWPWWKGRIRYYIPATRWLPKYTLADFGGDFTAALTVAAVMVPLSLSYASSLARISPLSGPFAAAVQPLVYSFLGSCNHLSIGPEASLSLLVGQAIERIIHDNPHVGEDRDQVGAEVTTMITFQVGMISLFLGLLRLGFIDVVLSRPLLRGFVTAVSVVIIIEQCVPMLGLSRLSALADSHSALDKLVFVIKNVGQTHVPTAILSLCSLVFLVIARTIKTLFKARVHLLTYLPEILICVIVTTALSDGLSWNKIHGIEVLGAVSFPHNRSFFAPPLLPRNLQYFRSTFPTAVFICIIGFIDSIVAAKQNAQRFRYSVSPNRELTALGAGNLVASFIPSTLPAWGAITRSRLVADTGGRTPLSGALMGVLVLLSIRFLLPALYFLPKPVLACIICLVVYTIVVEMPEDIRFYSKMGAWNEMFVMLLTFALTLIWSVEVGIGIPFALTLLSLVKESSRQRISILARVPGTTHWEAIDENPDVEPELPGILVVRIRENLNFANTGDMKERLRRLELYGHHKHHPSDAPMRHEAVAVVFQMADVEEIDASAIQIFLELTDTYTERHVAVCFAHVRPAIKAQFEKAGIVERLGEKHFHPTVASAVDFIEGEVTSHAGAGVLVGEVTSG